MVFHMKTTLNIDETVMAQLKREAARQRRTMSELVETALRMLFRASKKREQLPPLPTFRSGGTLVDIAGRDALYQAMEERCPLGHQRAGLGFIFSKSLTLFNPELLGLFRTPCARRTPKNWSGYRIACEYFRTPCKVLVCALSCLPYSRRIQ
jgi:Ribbon-helix-helix protein, copG family